MASDVACETGDFVLRRGDGVFAYQLAVVVDDLAMGVTEVVRGADLLASTGRQVMLARLLGGRPPSYAHAPLVVAPNGERLAKRARGVAVRDHREAGVERSVVLTALARALTLARAGECITDPRQLVGRFDWRRVPKGTVVVELPLPDQAVA